MTSRRTPLDLDLYLFINKRELKNVDAKYEEEVGYWASSNHVQNYKDIWDGDQNVYIEVFEQLVTNLFETIHGQHTQQTKNLGHGFIGGVITYSNSRWMKI